MDKTPEFIEELRKIIIDEIPEDIVEITVKYKLENGFEESYSLSKPKTK